jgi:hypothetical protein
MPDVSSVYDMDYPVAEDYDLLMRLSLQGPDCEHSSNAGPVSNMAWKHQFRAD